MKNGERKSVYRYMSLSLSGCGFDIDEGPRKFPYQSPQVYIGPNTRPALTSDRIIFFAQFYNTGYLCTALRAAKSLIIESSDDSLSRFTQIGSDHGSCRTTES